MPILQIDKLTSGVRLKWHLGLIISSLIFLLLSSCKSSPSDANLTGTDPPTSTLPVYTETPTGTPIPTLSPSPPPNREDFYTLPTDILTITLYSDSFNPNWMLYGAQDEEINPNANTQVHHGLFSIEVTPKKSTSDLYFLLREGTRDLFPRPQIYGFRFKLNPGETPLDLSQLVVGILGGSKESEILDPEELAITTELPIIPATNLSIPGSNPIIPPNTWSDVIVWFDDSIPDPVYDYILGLYIRKEQTFLQTFFLDDVQLVVYSNQPLATRKPPTATPMNTYPATVTPTPTLTPTPTWTRPPYFTPTPSKTIKPVKPEKTEKPTKDPPTPPPVVIP